GLSPEVVRKIRLEVTRKMPKRPRMMRVLPDKGRPTNRTRRRHRRPPTIRSDRNQSLFPWLSSLRTKPRITRLRVGATVGKQRISRIRETNPLTEGNKEHKGSTLYKIESIVIFVVLCWKGLRSRLPSLFSMLSRSVLSVRSIVDLYRTGRCARYLLFAATAGAGAPGCVLLRIHFVDLRIISLRAMLIDNRLALAARLY